MPKLTVDLPTSLYKELEAQSANNAVSVDALIARAVSLHLAKPLHSLFQVSTSRSLVAGKYDGVITCEKLLEHGDFGLGTFAGLRGEMVVVDGRVFRIEGNGRISEALPTDEAPFATVTWFVPGIEECVEATSSLDDLTAHLDHVRRSDNLFYAVRIDGHFTTVKTRAVSAPAAPGATLVDAAKTQHEFEFHATTGTLVGFYSPSFAGAISVPGYHLHFLSQDRSQGGQIQTGRICIQVEELEDFHVALPENEAFLTADLSRDTSSDLHKAESAH